MRRHHEDHAPTHVPDLAWDPATGDVVCELAPTWDGTVHRQLAARRRFNRTQELWLYPDADWAWGDMSPAAVNYAAGILDLALPWTSGEAAAWGGQLLPCLPIVTALAHWYCAEVVAHIPLWGGTVRRRDTLEWVRLAAMGLSAGVAAALVAATAAAEGRATP